MNSYQTPFTISQSTVASTFELNNGGNRVPNPDFEQLKLATFLAYMFLLITVPPFFVIYFVLWSYIDPPVSLDDTGNKWTFILLFVVSAITSFSALAVVLVSKCTGFELRYKHMAAIDIILICLWCAILCVPIGALEAAQDSNACPHRGRGTRCNAPLVTTHFGKYIKTVCGNGTEVDATITDLRGGAVANGALDSAKCASTKVLKTSIWCMYILALMMAIATMGDITFGLGSFRLRWIPPYLYQ